MINTLSEIPCIILKINCTDFLISKPTIEFLFQYLDINTEQKDKIL